MRAVAVRVSRTVVSTSDSLPGGSMLQSGGVCGARNPLLARVFRIIVSYACICAVAGAVKFPGCVAVLMGHAGDARVGEPMISTSTPER